MEVAKSVYSSTLCWDCANATRPDVCPWVERFEPVDGWEATKTRCMSNTDMPYESYHVSKCPLFKRDSFNGGKTHRTRTREFSFEDGTITLDEVDIDIILAYAESGMRTYRAASLSHYDRRTVSQRLTSIRLKTGVDPRDFSGLIKLTTIIKRRRFDEE